jgi:S-adenosyl-L-methionine hydrolase (adenosine-forming)
VRSGIITLLTDFGVRDYFVGVMKGVILSRFPKVNLVDITHDILPHDIHGAAFTLSAAYCYFPPGTVHLVVVDPGVGSDRRAVIVESGEHLFVGPDNGVFSLVLCKDHNASVRQVTNSAYFLPSISATFHGRDIFSPVAAALANGVSPAVLGPAIQNPVCFELGRNDVTAEGAVRGSIIHIDRFGNCVTSFRSDEMKIDFATHAFSVRVKDIVIRELVGYYEEGNADTREPFLIAGSAGYLEISIARSSAARELNIATGESIILECQRRNHPRGDKSASLR